MIRPRWLLISCILLAFRPAGAAAIESLSVREKAGQLLMIGFSQKTVDTKLKRLLGEIKPGGLILFRRNLGSLTEIKALTSELRREGERVSGVEPFLAVDQEGGSVVRIPIFPTLPSAHSIGKAADEKLAFEIGRETGRILHWCGFNMNLAPVLDLSDPSEISFIGPRSFGSDPVLTGRMGVSFSLGLRESGVLPTAKHFPGIGTVISDPHLKVAQQLAPREKILKDDIEPFRRYSALDENSAIMVSQLSYPALDSTLVPAPFSRKILVDLLRGEIGYKGLVITDDLQMKGASLILAPEEAAYRSLAAGADMVMISWSQDVQKRAVDRIVRAVESGEWSHEELELRYQRIRRIKSAVRTSPSVLNVGRGPAGEPVSPKMEKFDLKLLDKNIQRDIVALPPLGRGRECVLSAQSRFIQSYRQGTRRKVEYRSISKNTTAADLNSVLKKCSRIVYVVNGRRTAHLVRTLNPDLRSRMVLVNLSLPSVIQKNLKFAGRLEIGYPHFHAGFRVAQALDDRAKKKAGL